MYNQLRRDWELDNPLRSPPLRGSMRVAGTRVNGSVTGNQDVVEDNDEVPLRIIPSPIISILSNSLPTRSPSLRSPNHDTRRSEVPWLLTPKMVAA